MKWFWAVPMHNKKYCTTLQKMWNVTLSATSIHFTIIRTSYISNSLNNCEICQYFCFGHKTGYIYIKCHNFKIIASYHLLRFEIAIPLVFLFLGYEIFTVSVIRTVSSMTFTAALRMTIHYPVFMFQPGLNTVQNVIIGNPRTFQIIDTSC